jgi:hypothetical protein
MTEALIKSCKFKSKLLKIHRKYRNKITHSKYKLYSKQLKYSLKEAERKYYADKFKNHISTNKLLWKDLNCLLKSSSDNKLSSTFMIGSTTSEDPQAIVGAFNDYFTSIGSNLASNIPDVEGTIYDTLGSSIDQSLYLDPTNSFEIKTIISNLKNSMSAGPDGIPTNVIKSICPFICDIISHLINSSLSTDIFPDELKNSKITPIYKSDEKDVISN